MLGELEEKAPGPDQLITYGGTPPLGLALADPLQSPLHVTFVGVGVTVNVGGLVIVNVLTIVQPFESVIEAV
jgi:hypothetical protein